HRTSRCEGMPRSRDPHERTPMAIPRIRLRWRLRTLMILVAVCAVGLVIRRVYVERAPVYQLIGQLRTGNAQARAQAAFQIGQIGPKAAFAVDALASALDDPERGVRTAALDALIKIGSRSPRVLRAMVAEFDAPSSTVWGPAGPGMPGG